MYAIRSYYVAEKFRESWDWEVETPIHYYDYLGAFSTHSEEILLNIRRYERDIMDKNIPVSADDYKMLIKEGLKHYKKLYPNIKYIQIGNEYNGGSFMKADEDEYYPFYKIGYEALNEVNAELGLEGTVITSYSIHYTKLYDRPSRGRRCSIWITPSSIR